MEKVKHEDITIDVFENDIDLYLQQFKEEQDIKDLRDIPQTVWTAALIYIQRHVFNDRVKLKQHNNIYINNTITPTNCNSYNYELLNEICDYYIYVCSLYDKECSIWGYSKLLNIPYQTIMEWGNNYNKRDRLSTSSGDIYKKLTDAREQSLVAKLVSMKHPTAMAIILNKEYQYNLPGVSKEPAKTTLSSAELPKLSINSEQFTIESSGGGSDND
jgi:hypothetical protein